jgi:signal transduction histidine kinase
LTATQEELIQSEKMASLGAMVAGISHELNTPIGNTVTVSSTLQSQSQDFRKLVEAGQLRKSDLLKFLDLLDEMSEVILRSTNRAAELVTAFKQVAVDRTSERRREFDVATLVQELVTAFKAGMRQDHVIVTTNISAGILCDSFPGPVGQVLNNLMQNALTHGFGESSGGTIAIEAHIEGEKVVMRVCDNGCGMDAHTLKHAFDPFFTTRLGQGGSGLGLSVSHRIAATLLGGGLSVNSTLGQGSCFSFSFVRQLPK